MTDHEVLPTRHHQQDADSRSRSHRYRFTASTQMVLEQFGVGVQDQARVYGDDHNGHTTADDGGRIASDGLIWAQRRGLCRGSFREAGRRCL